MLLIWRSRRLGFTLVAILLSVEARLGFHNQSKIQITMAPVTAGAIARRVVATGTLRAVTTVDVGSEVAGVLQSLEADCNVFVHTGQVVARLDPSSYDAQLHEAQSALGVAETEVRGLEVGVQDARAKLTRAEALSARAIISQADLDVARTAFDEATARLLAGQAAAVQVQDAVDRAAADLAHTIIRSPVDGIVIERNVVAGQTLTAATQSPALFRIAADLNQLQMQVNIDPLDVDAVAPREPATFAVGSYAGETFHGTVSEVRLQPAAQQPAAIGVERPDVSRVERATTAIVDVSNPDERLRPGMIAEVTLDGPRHEGVVRIPNAALSFRPPPDVLAALGETDASIASLDPVSTLSKGRQASGKACEVWQYDGERLTPIAVRAGPSSDGWTELLSGPIHPGDPLVTSAVLEGSALKR